MSVSQRKIDNNHMDVLAETNVRIEKMFWIPSLLAIDVTPPDFDEFLEEFPEDSNCLLYQSLPELLKFSESYDVVDFEDFVYELQKANHTHGFIMQLASPVRNWQDETSCDYSWGYYTTEWAYAEDVKDIISVVGKFDQKHNKFKSDTDSSANPVA